jgi:F-type H+-transporting ATPase subunit gamma
MPGTREIRRRITSVRSTRKITRAMQMVSAAKMRKAQNATIASRTYAELAWELVNSVNTAQADLESPLLQEFPEAKKIGVVIISSNRGLVGSFNANLIAKVRQQESEEPELISELIVIGRKARDAAFRNRKTILAEFPKHDTTIPVEEIYPIATMLQEIYSKGSYQKIVIAYNHFISTLVQKPTVKSLLPLNPMRLTENSSRPLDLIYEPTPAAVLKHLLPRILESQIYQAILESDASEHSARMVMMKNATEAAGDLIDDLTLTYNQLRQNKITTELSEITAGKIALENR